MAFFEDIYDWEVSRYQLSDLEQDTLSNFPAKVSTLLITELRGAVMVFHNILPDLWHKGMRLRLVLRGKHLTEIPECAYLLRFTDKKGSLTLELSSRVKLSCRNSPEPDFSLHLNHHWQDHRAALGFRIEKLADRVADIVFDIGPVDFLVF
ncbi:MAG: hypothetical protein UX02_C0001G0081 [Candidatus Moranbacteria bacterium GW2011_GWC1_45_18]|nr:MAG: hypothetical protein UT79_C0002G0316 [Candidatus Moranbacteria bacterium GW2011_GWC2_40_12]KKT34155.1 MAG: hypothetical protein UW19_C0001G0050 [Candidatus Moranbacteria bacterium GW2011_GWF2_44_10]KKT70815.1 MAG: hypothetical protein UW66_C0037G0002 [Candidatus Moranbacteria bacterium GW2011_GWF1_44_4]KKU00633.1 MAG: hypothetical protein UX02_C0001G0081 [Candidatus Moranbacteria bacterium GW2011_GWC1_45_18]